MIWVFQSTQSFFGPVHSWREDILEEFFALQLHLNMSYSEVHKLPIRYRTWFLRRLVKHFDDKNKAFEDVRNGGNKNSNSGNQMDMLNKFEAGIKNKFGT